MTKIAWTLVMFALGTAASADTLHLKNGSIVIGNLLSAEHSNVSFETPFAGTLTIKLENVERIITDTPVIIMLNDGTVYRDRQINAEEGQLIATAAGEDPVVFAGQDIQLINPEPWKLGEGYKWTGDFNAVLEVERGNSDSDEWEVVGRTTWRSLKNRFRVDGYLEKKETSNIETKDKWMIGGKSDRFFSESTENYYGGRLRFEYDEFADLDLRTTIGAYLGRQFFDSSLLTLHAELGPVWVDEQFDMAEDDDFPGALWEIEATSDIVGFGTELYVFHDGILNFDSADELILNTRVGIRMPLIYGLQTGLEAKYEYDGGAVAGVDDLDETYNFFVGYKW